MKGIWRRVENPNRVSPILPIVPSLIRVVSVRDYHPADYLGGVHALGFPDTFKATCEVVEGAAPSVFMYYRAVIAQGDKRTGIRIETSHRVMEDTYVITGKLVAL